MTDSDWGKVRDGWRKKCRNGDLKCGPDMIPTCVSVSGEPWAWTSRAYVERVQEYCSHPEFQASVERVRKFLNESEVTGIMPQPQETEIQELEKKIEDLEETIRILREQINTLEQGCFLSD